MSQAQNEYRVTWTIEVSAEGPLDAARKARTIQLDPDSAAQVFNVRTVGSSAEAEFDPAEDTPPKQCPHCGGTDLKFLGEYPMRKSVSSVYSVHEWACQSPECERLFWS